METARTFPTRSWSHRVGEKNEYHDSSAVYQFSLPWIISEGNEEACNVDEEEEGEEEGGGGGQLGMKEYDDGR